MIKRQKPEILSPAGSYESFIAAMVNGCDAIYLGGKAFGARAYATNFDVQMLQNVVKQAHLYGKKVYYTLNTLVKDIEWRDFEKSCKELDSCNVDAVIIQDLGVYYYIQKHYPHWNIHASTQMNLHHKDDVAMARAMGFERVVVSRECSLEDIRDIKAEVPVEIEAFVHGALCYCYSGRCLMSSFYGGRSGNRGKCAQPCRLPYMVEGQEGYYLSPKDQMTLDQIPMLIMAGIDSFKIEGRMKKPEYVALTTRLYRKYTDLAYQLLEEDRIDAYQIEEADIEALNQMYNRGSFTQGYYKQHNSKEMISIEHSKHLGVKLGSGLVTDKGLKIEANRVLHAGDVLELHHTTQADRRENISLTVNTDNQRFFSIKDIPRLKHVRKASYPVYLIVNKQLNEAQTMDEDAISRIPVHMHFKARKNQPMSLAISYNGISVSVEGEIVTEAKTRGIDEKTVRKQLQKLGDTVYSLERLKCQLDIDVFVPVSHLNQIRRDAVQKLNNKRLEQHVAINGEGSLQNSIDTFFSTPCHNHHPLVNEDTRKYPTYTMVITKMEQLEYLVEEPLSAFERLYLDFYPKDVASFNAILMEFKSRHKHIQLYLAWPHIMTPFKEKSFLTLQESCASYIDGYLIRTLGQMWRLKDKRVPLALDYQWNLFNQSALSFVSAYLPVESMALSLEQNEAGLRQMMEQMDEKPEIYVYGHQALMISANCIYLTHNGTCGYRQEGHHMIMEDRKGEKLHVRTHCHMCYNTIHNSKPLYLLDKLSHLPVIQGQGLYRIEWTIESDKDMKLFLSAIERHKNNGNADIPMTETHIQHEEMTRGHFNKGVQ